MRISDWSSDVCSSDLFVSQRFTAPLDRYFFHVKHGVSFARRALCRAGPLCPGNPARGGVGRLSAPMAVLTDAGTALWSGILRGANLTAAPEIRGRQQFLFEETQLRDHSLIAPLGILLEIGEG